MQQTQPDHGLNEMWEFIEVYIVTYTTRKKIKTFWLKH